MGDQEHSINFNTGCQEREREEHGRGWGGKEHYRCTTFNKCIDSKEEEFRSGGRKDIKKHVCILLHSVSFSLVFIAAIISQ